MTKINIISPSGGGGGGSGTVTSVAVTTGTTGTNVNVTGSPITTSGTITVNIPEASGTNTGKLKAVDWTTFNNKQNAISLTTTGTSGAATFVGATLNIPQYQGTLTLTTTGTSGAATLIGTTLNIPQYAATPAGSDSQVQYNNGGSFGGASSLIYDDTNNRVGIGETAPEKKLHVKDSNQCVSFFESTTTGAGISFGDSTTTDNEQVGVGAFGDLLCLRGGGNSAGTVQISATQVDVKGNVLRNFIPSISSITGNLTIDSSNENTYCGAIIQVTGAVTITFDSSIRNGFNCSVIQLDANTTTIAVTGALNIRNRQGHTSNNGQYSIITILSNSTNLFLGGDTA